MGYAATNFVQPEQRKDECIKVLHSALAAQRSRVEREWIAKIEKVTEPTTHKRCSSHREPCEGCAYDDGINEAFDRIRTALLPTPSSQIKHEERFYELCRKEGEDFKKGLEKMAKDFYITSSQGGNEKQS